MSIASLATLFDMGDSQEGVPPPTPRGSRGSGSEVSLEMSLEAPPAKRRRAEATAQNSTLAVIPAPLPLQVCAACDKSPSETEWQSKKLFKRDGVLLRTEYAGRWCAGCLLTAKRAYPLMDAEVGMFDHLSDPKFKANFLKADRVRRGEETASFVPESVTSEVRVGYSVEESFLLYDEQQFRARFKCAAADIGATIETFTMPSGEQVSGVAVAEPGPRKITTYTKQERVRHSVHLEPAGHIRQEQAPEVHKFITTDMTKGWPKRMSHVEVEAQVRRADTMSALRPQAAISSRSAVSDDGCIVDDDGLEEELVEGKQDAPALHSFAGGSSADQSRVHRRGTARRRITTGRRLKADGDAPHPGTLIEALDGSGQKRKDDSSVEFWIQKLDVNQIMTGSLPKIAFDLRSARLLHERMIGLGQVGEALGLNNHIKLVTSALDMQLRYKTMPTEELLGLIDGLEAEGFHAPTSIAVEILKSMSRPVPGSPVPDADEVLDRLWMWPLDRSAPPSGFQARSPRLCDLDMSMPELAAAFKACYVDSYLGALLAMGPCPDIGVAADLFLRRWEAHQAEDDEANLLCPARQAAKGMASLA